MSGENEKKLDANARKLLRTFEQIIPDLEVFGNVVAFFCRENDHLIVFSTYGGEVVHETAGKSQLVQTVFKLRVENIPINTVNASTMRKVQSAFQHAQELHATKRRFTPAEKDHSKSISDLRGRLSSLI